MAGRVLLRATALGVAAAAAGSLHAVSKWLPPKAHPPFDLYEREKLGESARALQAALLNAPVLSGAHLDAIRARAEDDLACADAEGAEGDPSAAVDLRLLLALLATRDGRDDDALRLYTEAARDAPFDPRPRALAHHLCLLHGSVDKSAGWDAAAWDAAYRRLVPPIAGCKDASGLESYETRELIRELMVAAAVGGVWKLANPSERSLVMRVAYGTVNEGLAAVLQDDALPAGERLQFGALRVYLHAKVEQLVGKEKQGMIRRVGGDWETPVSW